MNQEKFLVKKFDLVPEFTTQKSFYGKATVEEYEFNSFKLFSYGTLIAKTVDGELVYLSDDINHYTNTTNKHLNEFFVQFANLPKMTKKDILRSVEYLKMYGILRYRMDLDRLRNN